jgi:hypothetical protein
MMIGQEMKYGQIAEGGRINDTIYRCFQYINEIEAQKFVKEFKKQPHDKIQVMHTLRELILGAYLSQIGFQMYHNIKIDSKTPDWCALDNSSNPQCIFELVNFHPDAETSEDIVTQIQEKGIWCNFVKPNTQRLYSAIWNKISIYKSLATKYKIPYVVSVFGEFTAIIDQEELDQCLNERKTGLFALYPEISGLLYFEEASGVYSFMYRANPFAIHAINLSSGRFQ